MRKLIAYILGDSSSLERSLKRSSAAVGKFGKNVDTSGAKLDKTAKRLSNLQTAFVGSVALTVAARGIRSVVDAAAESQQVLGQTSVALEATGHSWAQYGKQIEAVIQQQSKLGFDDEALLRTFSLFVRSTGDVSQALKLNALAADVARGRYIDLETAANLVNKAAIGQGGALRRLGIDVKANATSQELLTALTAKYGGAAKAAGDDAATAFQRAQVEMENARETIGGNLLPTVAGLATTLSDTLVLFQKIGQTKIPAVHIPMLFDFSTGDSTLGDLVHKGVFTLPEFVNLTEDIVNNLLDNWRAATEHVQADAAAQFEAITTTFTTNVINDALNKPIKIGPVTPKFTGTPGFGTGLTPRDILGPLITDLPIKTQQQIADAELAGKGIRAAHVKALKILTDAIDDPRLKAKDRLSLTRAAKAEQDAIDSIDEAAANAADSAAKDAQSKRDARRDKAAQKRADEARKARERRRKIAERERKEAEREAKQLQTRQFRAIGLSPEGSPIVPGVANLRQQFAQLGDRIEPGQLSSKLRKQFAGVGKLLRGDLGKVTESTREAINDLFKTIRDTFEQGSSDALKITPATTRLNTNRIVAGLGLDRDTERLIKSRLSGFNAAGRRLSPAPGTSGAFGITLTPTPVHINTTVNLDGQKVAQNTTIHQGKHRRSNPAQKRGPLRNI